MNKRSDFNSFREAMMSASRPFITFKTESFYHLTVEIHPKQMMHYIFDVDLNGNDYLCSMEIIDQSFEDTILDVWQAVKRNGYCSSMTVVTTH